jgi:hypothetical protein
VTGTFASLSIAAPRWPTNPPSEREPMISTKALMTSNNAARACRVIAHACMATASVLGASAHAAAPPKPIPFEAAMELQAKAAAECKAPRFRAKVVKAVIYTDKTMAGNWVDLVLPSDIPNGKLIGPLSAPATQQQLDSARGKTVCMNAD